MPSPTRFLQSSSTEFPATDPPINLTMDSDVVVVLASLLCALICVVGLALAARCAWLRRSGAQPPSPRSAANRGIKKRVLNSLPKNSFSVESAALSTDCAICLAEFEDGDQVRVLPPCGHGFHVACIDTWLESHSSCPSCRRVLVVPVSSRCQKCGATAASAANSGGSSFLC